jgi:hypothetical protein
MTRDARFLKFTSAFMSGDADVALCCTRSTEYGDQQLMRLSPFCRVLINQLSQFHHSKTALERRQAITKGSPVEGQ